MQIIYLVRHCEYDNPRNILPGRLPVPLSDVGLNQAKKLKEYFADKNIAKIYSSAVLRCQQTSEIISDSKIPIINDKRILEAFSAYQGYWGENWHEDGYHAFSHRDELGGENLEDMQKRMVAFWKEKIVGSTENIIVCSHGDPLQTLTAYLKGVKLKDENTPESEISWWLQKGEVLPVKILGNTQYEFGEKFYPPARVAFMQRFS